ncbi:hypothetical protein K2173_001116 [Erythroxylum novogranatense]|uniref:Diacylglycerol O-acyltransferase n=1 Tax=Erythroxylum novogranatense TaxID=1862640 RepID=A0AAV8S668_9ROSI|nr:hypothetical protein K2173_001116 [Erythroxylum novogranatense]
MGSSKINCDDLTPAGRICLHPEMDLIIHCAFGVKNPIDVDSIKAFVRNSLMVEHPRFCSLLVRDKKGVEHWKRTEIDIDKHIIIVDPTTKDAVEDDDSNHVDSSDNNDDVERIVNDYLADLSVTTPLSEDKPLWELHLLLKQNCIVYRIHHALGDGISLMSLFQADCRKADDPKAVPTVVSGGRRDSTCSGLRGNSNGWIRVLLGSLNMVLFSCVFCLEFKTVITGGPGVELWPRKLATAKFRMEDMKVVKEAIASATINDVLFGVISSGLSRYLDHRYPNALSDGLRLTGLEMDMSELMENNSRSRWGNKFGALLLPVYYQKGGVDDHLEYVRRAKKMIDRKKRTFEARFSYSISCLAAYRRTYRLICNTSFTVSNVVGPKEIIIGDNPVTFLRVNVSSMPQALVMHMVSYEGRADMQILVAKDIIPDPEFLAKCFEGALLDMKEAATRSASFNPIV